MSADMKRLVKADNRIQQLIQEFGLDCFPQEFDVIPAQKMLEIMSYHLPVNYSHWSFGREYEKNRTQYEMMGGIPYEVVLNSNPSRAFLMNTNPFPIQVLVMAHVYGHNDFMKNNIHFRQTRRDMVTSASEAASRFRKYEEEYGISEVEKLLDSAHSIQWHIDDNLFESDTEKDTGPTAQNTKKIPKGQSAFSDLFDYEGKNAQKSFENRREDRRQLRKRIPVEPEPDFLRFIMKHSPRDFEDWELDILSVVRDQAIYFTPQRKTKVMNEGWASFWHMRIMERLFHDGILSAEEHGFYNLYNARVIASNPFSINPYLLGIKTFKNIERRYNKGQYGSDWVRSEASDKWEIDTKAMQGMDKLFEVRRTHMDWFFLDEFLNHQVIEDAELYLYMSKKEGQIEEFKVDETDWRQVKDIVVRSFAHSGIPDIKVVDGDYGGKRELYLKHYYNGMTLEEEHCRNTLRHVHYLWDRPVHIETVENDGNQESLVQLSYNGKEYSRTILGAYKAGEDDKSDTLE